MGREQEQQECAVHTAKHMHAYGSDIINEVRRSAKIQLD